jgi:hypothetical protein
MANRRSAAAINNLATRVASRRDVLRPRGDVGTPRSQRSIPDSEAKVRSKKYFENRHGKTSVIA